MASDPLRHRPAAPPGEGFVPAHLRPLSLRTALRFASHLFVGLGFLGGILLFLALLLAIGAAVLAVREPMPLGDAIYFVLITAFTIGYGDITPQTMLGRVLAPLIGLIGMLLTGIIIAVAVRALDFTVREEMARQRAEDQPPPPAAAPPATGRSD